MCCIAFLSFYVLFCCQLCSFLFKFLFISVLLLPLSSFPFLLIFLLLSFFSFFCSLHLFIPFKLSRRGLNLRGLTRCVSGIKRAWSGAVSGTVTGVQVRVESAQLGSTRLQCPRLNLYFSVKRRHSREGAFSNEHLHFRLWLS